MRRRPEPRGSASSHHAQQAPRTEHMEGSTCHSGQRRTKVTSKHQAAGLRSPSHSPRHPVGDSTPPPGQSLPGSNPASQPCAATWPPNSANTLTGNSHISLGAGGGEPDSQHPPAYGRGQVSAQGPPVSPHKGHWPKWPGCLRLQGDPGTQGPTEEAHRQGGLEGGTPGAKRSQQVRRRWEWA